MNQQSMMAAVKENPTQKIYSELQFAYDFFNRELFESKLPGCLITLQRDPRSVGYFSSNRFRHRDQNSVTDEIAMNPAYFYDHSVFRTLSTLVHEMVHLQQYHFGRPSRGSYHNKKWAEMMEAVGLIASTTGEPGGNKVGQRVSHYIEDSGRFDKACQKLLSQGFTIRWGDPYKSAKRRRRQTRKKYICPECKLNAWAKDNAVLMCGSCQLIMTESLTL